MKKRTSFITLAAIIAAIYATLTIATWQFSSLAIQVRLAEALCILPAFTPAAIPGLTIGCALSNAISGNIIDTIFGTAATLLAAILTRVLAKVFKGRCFWLYPAPAVIVNAICVPLILYYGYGFTTFGSSSGTLLVLSVYALSVFIGQTVVCYGVGIPLYLTLKKHQNFFKWRM